MMISKQPVEGVVSVEAALLKVGGSALVRLAPKGLAWLRTRLIGKKILVVGPSRAGKTSFIEYARHGVIGHPSANIPETQQTEVAHQVFKISVGSAKTLELEVHQILDTAGQQGPLTHADAVQQYRPDAVVIVMPVNMVWYSDTLPNGQCVKRWLEDFFGDLARQVVRKAKMPKYFLIFLNKRDTVNARKYAARLQQVRRLLSRLMITDARGGQHLHDVFPTVLVQNKVELSLVDQAIIALARNLYKDK